MWDTQPQNYKSNYLFTRIEPENFLENIAFECFLFFGEIKRVKVQVYQIE